MRKELYAIGISLALITIGCSQSKPVSDQRIADAQRDYSEAELNRLPAPSTALAAVTNEFGTPVTTLERGSNSVLLVYTFPFNENRVSGSLSGFTVKVDGGRVSGWLRATQGSSGQQFSTKAFPTQVSHEFLVYTATKEDAPLVKELKLPDYSVHSKR